ncbi:ras-related protein Rap-2a [Prionailurus iriomotensis]
MREYKVVVLGSGGVGKSALTVQFVTGTFIEKYDPTIEDFYRKEIEVELVAVGAGDPGHGGHRAVRVHAGPVHQERPGLHPRLQPRQPAELPGYQAHAGPDHPSEARYEKVPVILVGNKVDLESEREVSSNEGRALAEEWGCPFMETSAKSKTMVDELFAEIVRQMNYAAQPDKDDPCCSACNIQ